jgi:hypothetical protein
MIEPWVSNWSKRVYPKFHHEPLAFFTQLWEFSTSGPLSGYNQALRLDYI